LGILRSLPFIVLSTLIVAVACSDDGPTAVGPTSPSTGLSPAAQSTDSYAILARGNRLPRGIEKAVRDAGGSIDYTVPEIGVVVASSKDPGFASVLANVSGIQEVGRDMIVQWIDPRPEVYPFVSDPPNSGDNDFLFDLQWGHAAIDAVESRNAGFTGAGARVAILDSGIDCEHPDFPNLNVPLSRSFVDNPDPAQNEQDKEVCVRPGVFFNHGSHVAGIAAAADNGVGVVGVAPDAEIVAVKVLSEFTGSGSFAGVAAGIVYAATIDADVINMSLGARFPQPEGRAKGRGSEDDPSARDLATLVNFLKRAVQFAHQSGVTIIASAGNDAVNRDRDRNGIVLPADLPHVISVSALAPDLWAGDPSVDLDTPASFTNFGQSAIDLSAPGGDFDQLGTPAGDAFCSIGPFGVTPCALGDFVISASSQSWFFSAGTSMAAPHVTGVAALIIGAHGSMHPSQVESGLRRTADDLGKPGRDDFYGDGRVNAARAVGVF